MKRLSSIVLLCVLTLSLGSGIAFGSQADDLRARIAEYEREEARLRAMIGSNKAEQQSLQSEINSIVGQISYMQSRIQATEAKIELTDIEIGSTEDRISETQKSMSKKREAIGHLIAIQDQQDRESLIANFLRFNDFSDFFQEIHDAVTIHQRISAIIVELTGYRTQLEEEKLQLGNQILTLEQLNAEQEHQKIGLGQAKNAKAVVLNETKGEESAYQAALTEVEKQKQAFFIELQAVEGRIIAGGKYIVHVTASGYPAAGNKVFSSPEGPGYVRTQGYGWTTYAQRGSYGGAIHNGQDMASGPGTLIHPIGIGVVIANGTNKGWGNWVAIQHPNQGNLVSVYAHMSSFAAAARVGGNVSPSDVIGYEGSTGFSTGSHLHLSLYAKFFTFLNDVTGELGFNYGDTLNPASYVNL